MKKYKHIFFDLDRTLWDFELNSENAIKSLFDQHDLYGKLKIEFPIFIASYKEKNHALWADYRIGNITKDELRLQRYYQTFLAFGFDDEVMALRFNDDYVAICSQQTGLISGATDLLNYLSPTYNLHIITNGFIEAQQPKLDNSGLSKYFDQVIISDGFGYRKPDKRIFHHAMKKANALSKNSLMIGDDYGPDILGAKGVGMDQAYFCHPKEHKEATYVINSLSELKQIL